MPKKGQGPRGCLSWRFINHNFQLSWGSRALPMLLTGTHELDLGSVRRNMPDPIPMAVLGCLAVDRNWQGGGIGGALLQDAVLRTLLAAAIMGIRGILVYAIFDEAKVFHERHGFKGLREQSDDARAVAQALRPNQHSRSVRMRRTRESCSAARPRSPLTSRPSPLACRYIEVRSIAYDRRHEWARDDPLRTLD